MEFLFWGSVRTLYSLTFFSFGYIVYLSFLQLVDLTLISYRVLSALLGNNAIARRSVSRREENVCMWRYSNSL